MRVTDDPPAGILCENASCGPEAICAEASTTEFRIAMAQNAATKIKADRSVRTVDLIWK